MTEAEDLVDDHGRRMREHRQSEHDAVRFSPQAWLAESERNLAAALLLLLDERETGELLLPARDLLVRLVRER